MTALFIWNLNFSLLFLFYVIALKRLTFFRLNRVYLLLTISLPTILPFLDLRFNTNSTVLQGIMLDPAIVGSISNQAHSFSLFKMLSIIYWFGVGMGVSLIALRLYQVRKLYLKSAASNDAPAYKLSDGQHAFSFLNHVYLGKNLQGSLKDMVLKHEAIHIKEWHSIDVLLFSVAQILNWFNPLVHLAINEVQLNHEYRADEQTSAVYKTDYQYTLVNEALHTELFPITNSFYKKSIIKNRIMMMNKKRSNKRSLAAYLSAAPLLVVSLWTTSCQDQIGLPDSEQKSTSISEIIKPSELPIFSAKEIEVMPSFPGGQEALYSFLGEAIIYPESLKAEKVEGKVFVGFIVNENGSLSGFEITKSEEPRLNDFAIEALQKMPDWVPGQMKGKAVKAKMVIPIVYRLS